MRYALALLALATLPALAAEPLRTTQARLYGVCQGINPAKPANRADGFYGRCPSDPVDGSGDRLVLGGCLAVAARRSADGLVLMVVCNGGATAYLDSRPAPPL